MTGGGGVVRPPSSCPSTVPARASGAAPPGPGLRPLLTSARGFSVPGPGASGKLLSPTPYGFSLPRKHLNWRVPCSAQAPRRVPVPRGVKETG